MAQVTLSEGSNVIARSGNRMFAVADSSSVTRPVSGRVTVNQSAPTYDRISVDDDGSMRVTLGSPSGGTMTVQEIGTAGVPLGGVTTVQSTFPSYRAGVLSVAVDPAHHARQLTVDPEGRVICAPGSHDAVAGIYQVTEARYDRLIRNQDELLAAVRVEQSWRYDMRSSLLGAGAALVFLVVALALLLRGGAK